MSRKWFTYNKLNIVLVGMLLILSNMYFSPYVPILDDNNDPSFTITTSDVMVFNSLYSDNVDYSHVVQSVSQKDKNQLGLDEPNPPTVYDVSGNVTYDFGDTGNAISWTPDEAKPRNMVLYRNGTIIDSGPYEKWVPLVYNVDGLSLGAHNYTLWLDDTSDNSASFTLWVFVVDGTLPVFISTPGNLIYDFGITGNDIAWILDEPDPRFYNLFRNGTSIDFGFYSDQTPLNFDIDGLAVGVYNYTLYVDDDFDNFAIDTSWITVTNPSPPIIVQPSNYSYGYLAIGNTLSWDISDYNLDAFELYRNGSLVNSGSLDGSPVVEIIDGLSVGFYNYTIMASDTDGLESSTTSWVEVIDDGLPQFIAGPSNIIVEYDSIIESLSWNYSDRFPDTYTIYRNGILQETDSWISNQNISISILDSLIVGDYNYTIAVLDTSGYTSTNFVWVYVQEYVAPILTDIPSNSSYPQGSTGNLLSWTATDLFPFSYNIYRNSSFVTGSGWLSGVQILIGIDGLIAGIYNFSIEIFDTTGNSASSTTWITVIDGVPPELVSSSGNVSYSLGTTGHILQWVALENNPSDYQIYKDGVIVQSSEWSNAEPISINIDGLEIGDYNYTIVFQDQSNNILKNTIWVAVRSIPVITNAPADFGYLLGSTTNTLSWTVTDSNPHKYILLQNGTQVNNGIWSNGISFSINIDGLLEGIYNFTILLNDTTGFAVTDTVYVLVTDQPIWDAESPGLNYTEGTSNNYLEWDPSDTYPNQFTVYINGSLYTSGTWNNTDPIRVNVNGLTKGVYNFTIVIDDLHGNSNLSEAIVQVNDDIDPSLISITNDFQYIEGDIGNTITWNTTDFYPGTYSVYQNGSIIFSGSWNNSLSVTIGIDGLVKGLWNITIEVLDESLNSLIIDVEVTVIDLTDPVVHSSTSDFDYPEGSSGNEIVINATDRYYDQYDIYIDEVFSSDGFWSNSSNINVNVDGLSEGIYNITIVIYDSSNNFVSIEVYVEVTDIPQLITNPGNFSFTEGTTGNLLTYNTTDSSPANFYLYKNGTIFSSDTWNNIDNIEINIDSLERGIYNFTLLVNDTANNYITHTIFITVEDQIDPNIEGSANLGVSENTPGLTVEWTVTDLHAGNYTIYQDDVFVASGSWINGVNISRNIEDLTNAIYNFTLYVQDDSGNLVYYSTIVTIIDNTPPVIANGVSQYNYIEGTSENLLVINSTDFHPGTYTLYVDGLLNVSLVAWTNTDSISINIDNHLYGFWNYTFVIFDQSGNARVHTTIVFVTETIPPVWVTEPSSIAIFEGTTGNDYAWQASDIYTSNYTIYVNGSVISQGLWVDSTDITYSADTLTYGLWNITILLDDLSGNLISSTIMIDVQDNTVPIFLDNPNDIVNFNEGTAGNSLSWTANDINSDYYELYIDEVQIGGGSYNESLAILVNPDAYVRGIYNITIIFTDLAGNTLRQEVTLTVIDSINPIFTSSQDNITMNEGDTGISLVWEISDLHPENYELRKDGNLAANGLWITQVNFLLVDMEWGLYQYDLTVFDDSNNFVTYTVYITVNDNDFPIITTSAADLLFVEGTTGNELSWGATDKYSSSYTFFIESTPYGPFTWGSGDIIPINLDFLQKGIYNVTILFEDQTGNYISESVIVEVIDNTNPIFTSDPPDILYYEESGYQNITWGVFDNYPQNYIIYFDGIPLYTNGWGDKIEIEINQEILVGFYNYSIIVYDASGNYQTSTVIVTVVDAFAPVFVSTPPDETLIIGVDDLFLIWNVTDNHPFVFSIFVNGEPVREDAVWFSGFEIIYQLDPIEGEYNVTIYAEDLYGNIAIDSVVDRLKLPETVDTQAITLDMYSDVYEGDVDFIEGYWLDINGTPVSYAAISVKLKFEDVEFLWDFQTDSEGYYGLSFNYTGIKIGKYQWIIEFTADFYQTQSSSKGVQVHPHKVRIIIEYENNLTRGEDFTISVAVKYDNNETSSLSLNKALTRRTGAVIDANVELTIVWISADESRSESTVDKEGITDLKGNAIIIIPASETQNIFEIKSMSASVTGENIEVGESEIPDLSLLEVNDSPSGFLENIQNNLGIVSLYLLLLSILISVSLISFFIQRNTKRKLTNKLIEELGIAKTEISALRSISHVIIQTKSGLPLFELEFQSFNLDTVLISGMTTAISSFLSELDAETMFGFETMERQNLSITSHKSEQSNFITISDESIPLIMMDQIKKAHAEINNKFKRVFSDGARGYAALNNLEVLEIFVSNNFKIDLLLEFKINTAKIIKIQKINSISRLIRQNLNILLELEEMHGKDHIYNIKGLFDEFKAKNIGTEMTSSIVLLMYLQDGIKPIFPQ